MTVHSLPFLQQVHALLRPRTYLEIGVRNGYSLALSRTTSIGIDPAAEVAADAPIGPQVTLHRTTSDDFFAGPAPLAAFDPPVIDLALIDGTHLFERALRDFTHVERHTGPGSVVILGDVLPRTADQATRERLPRNWTGDVWKIVPVLREIRPDLILLLIRTTPAGLLLVLGADLTDADLTDAYERLAARHSASGEEPTAEILTRSTAVYPTWVIGASFWEVLRRHRETGTPPAQGREELLAALQQWASTTLNDRQARAIHPTLSGRPHAPRKAARPPGSARLVTGRRAQAEHEARRVIHGVHRGLRTLVRAVGRTGS